MKRSAFTLIELVIATVILTVVVVSVSSAFSVGIKAWRRGTQGHDIQKVRLALLKIQKELRSSFFFSRAAFRGTASEMTFPLCIPEENASEIYIITYRVDEGEGAAGAKALVREKRVFTENSQDGDEPVREQVFPVKTIGFKYAYGLKDGHNEFEWQDLWLPESQKSIPLAIKISFQLANSDDVYNKTIFISQGALGEK